MRYNILKRNDRRERGRWWRLILVFSVAGASIFGILYHKYEETGVGLICGLCLGGIVGVIITFIVSIILYFTVSPVVTEKTYKLERHIDTSSYTYYVDVDNSKYALSYFDENTIIREEGIDKAFFTFEEKSGEVKITKKRYGGALDLFFFSFYSPQYDITIPSKEYIRYE